MSVSRFISSLLVFVLRPGGLPKPRLNPKDPRILVIRRNRMGDMIYTLPLLHALRRLYPQARLTVACDAAGEPIARACAAVDGVVVLRRGLLAWPSAARNAARLQGHDWIIAAKGGFDRRLALLTRLTNGAIRIGFEPQPGKASPYYTDAVALPGNANEEHQIETLLRLAEPLGLVRRVKAMVDLSLQLPAASRTFASAAMNEPPFYGRELILINISSTVALKFRRADFIALAIRILATGNFAVGWVGAPRDFKRATELAARVGSINSAVIATPGPLDLAALLEHALCLVTPEGGAAHLAASVEAPALVIWSEGPFEKWHSRGKGHVFVHAGRRERRIPIDRVWDALQPLLIRDPQRKKPIL